MTPTFVQSVPLSLHSHRNRNPVSQRLNPRQLHARPPPSRPVLAASQESSSPDPSNDPIPDTSQNPPQTPQPPHSQLSVSTAVSSASTLNAALAEATSRSLANLSRGGPPHLAIVFVSVRYSMTNVGQSGRHSMDLVVPRLRALIPTLKAVVGCTTNGVIGDGPTTDVVEVENSPALSLTLMRLPGITVTPFHVMPDDLPSLDARQDVWHNLVGRPPVSSSSNPSFMLFSDPSFADRGELDRFLSGIEYAYPGSSVVGALASAAAAFPKGHMFCTLPRDILSPEANSLRDSGLVGLTFSGDVQIDCLVSQGCRAIGPEFEVRKVGPGNVILEMELAGRPSSCLRATGQLQSIISYASKAEKELLQENLHIGISVNEYGSVEDNMRIRHVINVDMFKGGIAVACDVHVGQRVTFCIMEREAALRALDKTMQKYKRVELANSLVGYSNPPFGAVVFADVGRGQGLFSEPATETRNLTSFAPGVPVTGCFSAGQIGPCRGGSENVGRPGILHMAANVVALLRRRSGMTPADPIERVEAPSPSLDGPQTDD